MKSRKGCLALLLFFFNIMACPCDQEKKKTAEVDGFQFGLAKDSFALLYTTSVHGSVEPCGCTSQPLGGIARLATVVKSAQNHFSLGTTFLDGGDLLFESTEPVNPVDMCQQSARVDLLLSTLKELSCQGTFSHIHDDAQGVEFRERVLAKHQIENLTERARTGFISGSKEFPLGVLLLSPSESQELNKKAEVLKAQGAKSVIAISHLTRSMTQSVVQLMPLIDLVILASVSEDTPSSVEIVEPHGTIFVSAGNQGQYLGIVEFHSDNEVNDSKWKVDNRAQERESRKSLLSKRKETLTQQIKNTIADDHLKFLRKRLEEAESELRELLIQKDLDPLSGKFIVAHNVPLSKKIQPDPSVDEQLKAYEKQIPSLVAKCEVNIVCPKIVVGKPTFVGAESCKTCHASAYNFWKKAVFELPASDEQGHAIQKRSGHSKAWETLEVKSKTEDRSCIGCHSVGFMQPGGYCKVKEVGPLKNIQCESCHGAGSLHAQSGDKKLIRREVPEAACRECHHVPHIATTESFVYSERIQKILGVGHGELFLKKFTHEGVVSNPKN